jgi:pilus assembly protein CpaE
MILILTTQVRDKLAVIVPGSDFIFVVVTRELSSVRNARLILDELERNSSTNSSEKQKISKNIIILNDKMPAKADELSNEDIENYLARKIDIFSPFQKNVKQMNTQSDLYGFAAKMLGKDFIVSGGRKKRSFGISSFLKKK